MVYYVLFDLCLWHSSPLSKFPRTPWAKESKVGEPWGTLQKQKGKHASKNTVPSWGGRQKAKCRMQDIPFWDPSCGPKTPHEKVYVGPLFGVLSQEMMHINFFVGVRNWGCFGWGSNIYVEKVGVLFLSLNDYR